MAPAVVKQDSTSLSQECCEPRSAIVNQQQIRIFMPAINSGQQEVTRDAIGT